MAKQKINPRPNTPRPAPRPQPRQSPGTNSPIPNKGTLRPPKPPKK